MFLGIQPLAATLASIESMRIVLRASFSDGALTTRPRVKHKHHGHHQGLQDALCAAHLLLG